MLSRLRESIRQSFVVTPLVGLILGLLLALVTTDIDSHLSHELAQANDELVQSLGRPNATVIAAVGPAMLTFLGVVFSITLVALQWTPRSFVDSTYYAANARLLSSECSY